MSERPNLDHTLTMDYLAPDGKYWLTLLRLSLMGMPDTPSTAEFYQKTMKTNPRKDYTPIYHNKKVIPAWALLDLYKLMELQPNIKKEIVGNSSRIGNLPTLDEVLDSMETANSELRSRLRA